MTSRTAPRSAFTPQRRYPLEPLERLVAIRVPPGPKPTTGPIANPLSMFLQGAGMDRTVAARWRRQGGIPEESADRLACALGEPACLIWSDWFDGIEWDEDDA